MTDMEEFQLDPSSEDSWHMSFVAFGNDTDPQRPTPKSNEASAPHGGDVSAAWVADDTGTEHEQSWFDLSLSSLMDDAVRKLKASPGPANHATLQNCVPPYVSRP